MSFEINPFRTIEPNVGVVEVPDPRTMRRAGNLRVLRNRKGAR